MLADYIISTDDSSDLPLEFFQEHKVPFVQLGYVLDGKEYHFGEMDSHDFYQAMRDGKTPITTQVNQQQYVDKFTPYLKKGMDILHLAFSSGLSGTCANAIAPAEQLAVEFPDRKIHVVDTLCASLGEGLFVYKVVDKKEKGASFDEVVEYAEQLVPHIAHSFTVDDLVYLHRGGRVSKASAIAGGILGIKPVLYVDDEGHLIPSSKVRGRKQALNRVVDEMERCVGNRENDIFMVSHGDCIEDANYVAELVKKRFGIEKCLINPVGSVIGAHSGPGTIALFMEAERRKP